MNTNTLPLAGKRGLIVGMIILMIVYLAINAIYLHVLPFHEMRALPPGATINRSVLVST